jgi:hypothetical protein
MSTSGKTLSLIVVILSLSAGCTSNRFPTLKEIDNVFAQYRAENTDSKKTALIADLLKMLSNPSNVEEDHVVMYAISSLKNEYEKTGDEPILIAVDGTKIDGGFANFICEFYRSARNNRKFVQRYQNNPERMKAIERCIGITFSEVDLREIKAPLK